MKFFEKNVGKTDQIIRIVIGLLLMIGSVLFLSAPINYVLAIIGLILILTGVFRTCGLYSIIGLNTCKIKSK